MFLIGSGSVLFVFEVWGEFVRFCKWGRRKKLRYR